MKAIVTVFESKKIIQREGQEDLVIGDPKGAILSRKTYELKNPINDDGSINSRVEKKNTRILKDIQRKFEKEFDTEKNFLAVQFDITQEREEE